jgi:hypothetical protein
LTIRADGRVVAEFPDGVSSLAAADLTRHVRARPPAEGPGPRKQRVLEGKLSARELGELLRFALDDQEFFDFDPDAVKAAIGNKYHSDGNVFDSTDATTTSFHIRTADGEHEVSWFRLAKSTWDFPKVQPLLQLSALDRRLQQVFYVLLAGGPERVEEALEKANALVVPYYRLYPNAPRLTAADLFVVTPAADGSRTRFTFSRNKDKTIRSPLFEVSIDVPRQGEPRIVYVIPPKTPEPS